MLCKRYVLCCAAMLAIGLSCLQGEIILLKDGSRLLGQILQREAGSIRFATSDGIVTIFLSEIESIDGQRVSGGPSGAPAPTSSPAEKANPSPEKTTAPARTDSPRPSIPANAKRLGAQEEKVIRELVKSFQPEKNWDHKERSLEKLVRMGERVVPYLGVLLLHPSCPAHMAEWLVRTLGKIGTPSAAESLYRYVDRQREKSALIAFAALAAHPHPRVSELLLQLLPSGNESVKNSVLNALSCLKDPATAPALLSLSISSDPARARAARVLKSICQAPEASKTVGPLLMAALPDSRKSPEVRKSLIELLGILKYEGAVGPLREILFSEDANLPKAAQALALIASRPAIDALAERLRTLGEEDDAQATSKIAIVQALAAVKVQNRPGAFMVDLLAAQNSPHDRVRDAALKSLVACTGKNFANNVSAWQRWWEDRGSKVRERTEALLAMLDSERKEEHLYALRRLYAPENSDLLDAKTLEAATRILLARLEGEEDAESIGWILESMGRLNIVRALPAFEKFLDDPEPAIRAVASRKIVHFPDVAPRLHRALEQEEHVDARVAMISTLGTWKRPDSVPLLREEIQSSSPEVRIAAAKALGSYGDAKHLPVLVELLQDPVPEVVRSGHFILVCLTGKHIPPDYGTWSAYAESEEEAEAEEVYEDYEGWYEEEE